MNKYNNNNNSGSVLCGSNFFCEGNCGLFIELVGKGLGFLVYIIIWVKLLWFGEVGVYLFKNIFRIRLFRGYFIYNIRSYYYNKNV